jgi:hypothetical protein
MTVVADRVHAAPLGRRLPAARVARRLIAVAFAATLPGCGAGEPSADGGILADSVRLAPLERAFRLDEASAAAVSRRHDGIVYTINDSGNEEVLYAFDTTGNAMGRWVMRRTRNRDWEALAATPCTTDPAASCILVGDVGDNSLSRPTILIYQVREPDSLAFGSVGELHSDSLIVRFADGPHNVESMVRAADGGILLFPKEVMRRSDGTRRPTLVYRVAPGAWATGGEATAVLADSVPIVPGAATRQQVTDAAMSRDGRLLAVRTYSDVWLFAADSLTGLPRPGIAPVTCSVAALREPQGEGVGIVSVGDRSVRLVLTTEGDKEPFRFVSCPRPSAADGVAPAH